MFHSAISQLLLGTFFLTLLTEQAVCSNTGGDASLVPGLCQTVLSDLRRLRVNQPLTFPILGNDIDSAGILKVTQQPDNGTLTVNGKQLTFTPNNGVSGHSVGLIKAEWPDGASDTASIELHVEQVGKEIYFDGANGHDTNPGTTDKPKKNGRPVGHQSCQPRRSNLPSRRTSL